MLSEIVSLRRYAFAKSERFDCILDTRQVKQGLPRLLWVKSGKGLKPAHLSNEETSGRTSKKMYILLVLLAKMCQDKKRAHFYNFSVFYP